MNMLKKQKDDIRQKYSQIRRDMDREERRARDEKLSGVAVALMSFRYAEYVLLYAATEFEINIDAVAREALRLGKKVAFPKCNTEDHTMQYHFITSLDELQTAAYGIKEPPEENPVYQPEVHLGSAVCFVPALVYDKNGYRLGHGKGFYDRYLSAFSGCTIGVTYSEFVLPSVPRGRFDLRVDTLLTEKGVRACET